MVVQRVQNFREATSSISSFRSRCSYASSAKELSDLSVTGVARLRDLPLPPEVLPLRLRQLLLERS